MLERGVKCENFKGRNQPLVKLLILSFCFMLLVFFFHYNLYIFKTKFI